jgi:hypothetical protein
MASCWIGLREVSRISVSGPVALCPPLRGVVVTWFVTGFRSPGRSANVPASRSASDAGKPSLTRRQFVGIRPGAAANRDELGCGRRTRLKRPGEASLRLAGTTHLRICTRALIAERGRLASRSCASQTPFCTPSPGWPADYQCGAELGILRVVQGRWMPASWTTSSVRHTRGNGDSC